MAGSGFEGLIAGNTLVSYDGVPRQSRDDIADMLMYADFFASQSYRRHEFWTSWLDYYRSQLVKVGCRLEALITKEPMVISDASELDEISFIIKGSVPVDNLIALTQRSMVMVRLDEFAESFFQYGAGSSAVNGFQIVPCVENAKTGKVHLLLCSLHVSTSVESDNRGGSWRTNREMIVRLGGGVYSFDSKAYELHRDRIRTRLQQVARFNIRHISV
ncbi:MAG TPA: hypothetical protein VF682_19690 [Pseudomonas sp.]|jgi:hypothetical protein